MQPITDLRTMTCDAAVSLRYAHKMADQPTDRRPTQAIKALLLDRRTERSDSSCPVQPMAEIEPEHDIWTEGGYFSAFLAPQGADRSHARWGSDGLVLAEE